MEPKNAHFQNHSRPRELSPGGQAPGVSSPPNLPSPSIVSVGLWFRLQNLVPVSAGGPEPAKHVASVPLRSPEGDVLGHSGGDRCLGLGMPLRG